MLGCGENPEDVEATLRDLRGVGCDVVTFGQYLRPSKRHMPMREYITPEAFKEWQRVAEGMGFLYVASGPMVRSSYRAGEFFMKSVIDERRAASAKVEAGNKMGRGVGGPSDKGEEVVVISSSGGGSSVL
ncbi:unnamed protein product [Discosporangium mesarthrocarpum]